jgi:predicted PolB exonuclease-like 3'-5' exonuclease
MESAGTPHFERVNPSAARPPMSPILAFDIETVPDIAGLRRLRPEWAELGDDEVAALAFAERRAKTGSDFLPLHLHRVVVISCAFRDGDGFRVKSIGSPGDGEAKLIQGFFATIGRHTPQLVSWNGAGFDLPVLHYRGLLHGVSAPRYWDLGEDDRDFKWNNYINRYHTRHVDLMDLLALYQPRAYAPMDELAKLAGFPGKLGMDGSKVWDAYRSGEADSIRRYCETDAVNTYLLFARFQKMRGVWSNERHASEESLVRATLVALGEPQWKEYLAAWPER